MNAGLAISAVMVASLPPAVACAEPAFKLFEDICIATGGDAKVALGIADARGWNKLSKEKLANFPNLAGDDLPTEVDGRVDGDLANARGAVVVGRAARMNKSIEMGVEFCVVATRQADPVELEAEMAHFAAVPKNTDLFEGTETIAYAWRDDSDGRKAVVRAELEAPESAVGAKILVAQVQGTFAMVGLLTPTK